MTLYTRVFLTVVLFGFTWEILNTVIPFLNTPDTAIMTGAVLALLTTFFLVGWCAKKLWPIGHRRKKDENS